MVRRSHDGFVLARQIFLFKALSSALCPQDLTLPEIPTTYNQIDQSIDSPSARLRMRIMADPLSIIGAIAASQQIISRLKKVIKLVSVTEKEKDSMILRLDHHSVLLQHFSELLADFESQFEPDRRDHFDLVIKHMQVLLKDTLIKTERIKNKKASRLLWILVATDLRNAEQELFDWSQRLMLAFAFTSTPVKTNFIERFSGTKDGTSLPGWLLGLKANIRMEQCKIQMDDSCSTLEEMTQVSTLGAEEREKLWIDRVDTTSASRFETMSMDEVQLEVLRLFAVLKQADSMSTRILPAERLMVSDDKNKRFWIASRLPQDTCRHQRLSEMLCELPQHVSLLPIQGRFIHS
jgi:hypothetical protein